jgi:predicted nucleic acid-binding protein
VIVVDTSVWVDHLRAPDFGLIEVLKARQALVHPFVVGELACGNLSNRSEVLRLLRSLPQPSVASHDEVLAFITGRRLMGHGIGYIDVHLLASVVLDGTATLWTRDQRLVAVATDLGLAYKEPVSGASGA